MWLLLINKHKPWYDGRVDMVLKTAFVDWWCKLSNSVWYLDRNPLQPDLDIRRHLYLHMLDFNYSHLHYLVILEGSPSVLSSSETHTYSVRSSDWTSQYNSPCFFLQKSPWWPSWQNDPVTFCCIIKLCLKMAIIPTMILKDSPYLPSNSLKTVSQNVNLTKCCSVHGVI